MEDKYGVVDRPAPLPLIFEDPPRHTRLRRLVNRPLARKEINKFVPYIEELVDDLLDAASGSRATSSRRWRSRSR